MTHFNRPLYSKMCLEHLIKCDGIRDYEVICYIEPSDTQTYDVVNSYNEHLNLIVVQNKERRFNSQNIYHAMKHGFTLSDYVIHVEDDIILAKDALEFFEWGRNQRGNGIVDVCSYTRRANDRDTNIWESYHQAKTRRWFVPWGWATWKDIFDRTEELNLWNDQPGFDMNINDKINGYELYPHISRSQNIGGLNGFHIESAAWHYNNHFTPLWVESYDLIKHYLPDTSWFLK